MKLIEPMESFFYFMLKNRSTRDLKFNWELGSYSIKRWAWCDAFFMGQTVWATMTKKRNRVDYLKFMDQEYHFTYGYLDKKEF